MSIVKLVVRALIMAGVLVGGHYVIAPSINRAIEKEYYSQAKEIGEPSTSKPGELDTPSLAALWEESTNPSDYYVYSIDQLNHTMTVYLKNKIPTNDDVYASLVYQLVFGDKDAMKEYTLTISIAGFGGSAASAVMLYEAIKDAPFKKVIVMARGPSYSGHAFLALVGDELIVNETAFFMFHRGAVYDPTRGYVLATPDEACKDKKGKQDRGLDAYSKCVKQTTFYNNFQSSVMTRAIKAVLTPQEFKDYMVGDDVYISGKDLAERIKKRSARVFRGQSKEA